MIAWGGRKSPVSFALERGKTGRKKIYRTKCTEGKEKEGHTALARAGEEEKLVG